MGQRRDLTMAAARLLRAGSGIPEITYEDLGISAPAPYEFSIYTGKGGPRLLEALDIPNDRWHTLIWYSRMRHDGPQDALAVMRMSRYLPMLQAHYNTEVLPRRRNGE